MTPEVLADLINQINKPKKQSGISSSCEISTVVTEISTCTARTEDGSLVTHYLKEMSSFDNDVIWL